jgi:hypothetical protein
MPRSLAIMTLLRLVADPSLRHEILLCGLISPEGVFLATALGAKLFLCFSWWSRKRQKNPQPSGLAGRQDRRLV